MEIYIKIFVKCLYQSLLCIWGEIVFTSDKYLLVVYVMDFVSDPETVCAVTDACC